MAEIKERPLCRKAILKRGLAPRLVNGVWDARHSLNRDGEQGSLSAGMRKQMKKMVDEGTWGPITIRR